MHILCEVAVSRHLQIGRELAQRSFTSLSDCRQGFLETLFMVFYCAKRQRVFLPFAWGESLVHPEHHGSIILVLPNWRHLQTLRDMLRYYETFLSAEGFYLFHLNYKLSACSLQVSLYLHSLLNLLVKVGFLAVNQGVPAYLFCSGQFSESWVHL